MGWSYRPKFRPRRQCCSCSPIPRGCLDYKTLPPSGQAILRDRSEPANQVQRPLHGTKNAFRPRLLGHSRRACFDASAIASRRVVLTAALPIAFSRKIPSRVEGRHKTLETRVIFYMYSSGIIQYRVIETHQGRRSRISRCHYDTRWDDFGSRGMEQGACFGKWKLDEKGLHNVRIGGGKDPAAWYNWTEPGSLTRPLGPGHVSISFRVSGMAGRHHSTRTTFSKHFQVSNSPYPEGLRRCEILKHRIFSFPQVLGTLSTLQPQDLPRREYLSSPGRMIKICCHGSDERVFIALLHT